jgi:shikimate dehydrogenase
MHNAAFNELHLPHSYSLLDTPSDNLASIIETKIRDNSFGGANVTIPHKISVIKHVDELAKSAKKAGAVNTIECKQGFLIGHNTDAIGGLRALEETHINLSNAKVVILGAGGAASALAAELVSKVNEIIILNRTVEKARILSERLGIGYGSLSNDLKEIKSADILLNTTPIGMAPKKNISPVDTHYLHSGLLVYDIIYNPLKTRLMLNAEKIGAKTLGGLWMLVYQGAEAFKIWTGVEPNVQTMYKAALRHLEVTFQ